ncbi:MAG: class I tRNA ligase family protein, partial [Methylophilaceae bacterium]
EGVILMLNPFVPHISKTLWSELKPKTEIDQVLWPKIDSDALIKEEISIVIQVNGKLRANMIISIEDSEEKIKTYATSLEKVQKFIKEDNIKKIVYIKGRLINIVTG